MGDGARVRDPIWLGLLWVVGACVMVVVVVVVVEVVLDSLYCLLESSYLLGLDAAVEVVR